MIIGECKNGPVPPKRIFSKEAILRVCKYLSDGEHERHQNVEVSPLKAWRGYTDIFKNQFSNAGEFANLLVDQRERYLKKRKRSKPFPLAKHLFVAPARDEIISRENEDSFARNILKYLAPNSPAIYAWHRSPNRVELHLLVASTDDNTDNRETQIRKKMLIDGVRGVESASVQQAWKSIKDENCFERKRITRKSNKKERMNREFFDYLIQESRGQKHHFQNENSILEYLKRLQIVVTKSTNKSVSIVHPANTKPQRISWDDILFLEQEMEVEAFKKSLNRLGFTTPKEENPKNVFYDLKDQKSNYLDI